jgi:isopenicillin N synthase-like dioxygenase
MLIEDRTTCGTLRHVSDFEVFTLLHQTRQGLQLKVRGSWRWAPVPGPDSMIVIPDDMLGFWTNGLVQPMVHRVRPIPIKHFVVVSDQQR